MKRLIAVVCVLGLLLSVSAGWGEPAEVPEIQYTEQEIDLDLSGMSGTMIYAQISQILSDYRAYEGKIIRMKGLYDAFQDPNTGIVYLSCIIPDATACCAQGI